MTTIVELNHQVSMFEQLNSDEEGPVVLINIFTYEPSDEQAMLEAWKKDAELMQTQSGYISTQLHKGVGESPTYINYAVWESVSHFRNAFTNPEFQSRVKRYPSSVSISPHLFKKVAVEGICTN